MEKDTKKMFLSILQDLKEINYVKSENIPDIDLYMDQVTTFMDTHLSSSKRHEEDKILTKTMINNYAKNNLLPPPVKKKYSKDHMLVLTFIYYFKNILSIKDIETLLNPLTEKYFDENSDTSLTEIYENVIDICMDQMHALPDELKSAYVRVSKNTKNLNLEENEAEYLTYFNLICSLSFDVYIKKYFIEKLIDSLNEDEE
ncbi:DNA-binding transcriptional MerR regulator [Aequitasia blattaphilus]|uniref:DUF1836 domain-containing protein n=1 Tax=Aequitasia blattaphilus TaxID=2949332 RepID=A0ABT1E932_9FIRM|nr:DUF1836 domain-containing protein [Aequitasia blattaphilus]MCP1102325.1 DUF1836 domain-containing protein [Aequitasia blattaphilus]MCR8614965.1 DUF1836 domain-containing protein [Aequitasia blattaphilus]